MLLQTESEVSFNPDTLRTVEKLITRGRHRTRCLKTGILSMIVFNCLDKFSNRATGKSWAGLYSKFKASLGNLVRSCLNIKSERALRCSSSVVEHLLSRFLSSHSSTKKKILILGREAQTQQNYLSLVLSMKLILFVTDIIHYWCHLLIKLTLSMKLILFITDSIHCWYYLLMKLTLFIIEADTTYCDFLGTCEKFHQQ